MTQAEFNAISIDQFKHVMRRFAANVNVITSTDGKQTNGMTATAVCSVTADPPSALIIVNQSSRSYPLIDRTKVFAVNVLSAEQQELANHFASKTQDPFACIGHTIGETGCPLIDGADAHLECVVINQVDVGTHTIFVGKIVATDAAAGQPLLYHAGRYREMSMEHA